MAYAEHERQVVNHRPFAAVYADAAARLAVVGFNGRAVFSSEDLHKVVLQADDLSMWMLTNTTAPYWSPFPYIVSAPLLSLPRENIALVNGDNHDIALPAAGYVTYSGPTGAHAVTGFADGSDGRMFVLRNTTTQTLTIKNEVGSVAANRIVTATNADVAVGGRTRAVFIYDGDLERWVLVSASGSTGAA